MREPIFPQHEYAQVPPHCAFLISHFAFAQQYGWKDISNNLPDYPFDTTIINNGADTGIAILYDISFINDNEGWVTKFN